MSNVTSSPLRSGPRKESAVISGVTLDRTRPKIIRWGSLLLLLLSFFGTIAALHGGWAPFAALRRGEWAFNEARLFGGVALQAWCTAFQIYNRKRKWSFWYIQAFVLDVIPSTVGFHPILSWFFIAIMGLIGAADVLQSIMLFGLSALVIGGGLFTAIVAAVLAWLPENRLID